MKITLYRASSDDPLEIPDKGVYGDQYALCQLADRAKPRYARGRLESLYAAVGKFLYLLNGLRKYERLVNIKTKLDES